MREVCSSKRVVMKVMVLVMVLCFNMGILPSMTSIQSNVVVTAEAATAGQKNALNAAKDYLHSMSFSKKGLIEQLKFDGYSTKEANYAVENCGANWKKQAVKTAKSYLDTMSFSKKELMEQLEFDGFTKSEAKYGVSKAYK